MSKDEIQTRLNLEKSAILAEIDAAFANVDRKGGVSWSQAEVVDGYGSEEEQAKARAKDKETHWRQLVDDPKWETDLGTGGFSFLDPIGMRYYLPPAMIRCVRLGYDVGIQFQLTIPAKANSFRDWNINRFRLLNDEQLKCVARFLTYMAEFEHHEQQSSEAEQWQIALDRYWSQYLQ